MNKQKQKKRLVKSMKQRSKVVQKERLDKAWLNFWRIKTQELANK